MHIANPNLDIFGILGLFFAGMLRGTVTSLPEICGCRSRLHFSWNFFQSFLGFNVSGHDFYSYVITTFSKENAWNGGYFGFEGSVLSLIFQSVAIVVFYYILQNRRSANAVNPPNDFDEPA